METMRLSHIKTTLAERQATPPSQSSLQAHHSPGWGEQMGTIAYVPIVLEMVQALVPAPANRKQLEAQMELLQKVAMDVMAGNLMEAL